MRVFMAVALSSYRPKKKKELFVRIYSIRSYPRKDKSFLIASGLIAGGGIIGVLSNAVVILDDKWTYVSIMSGIDIQGWMLAAGMAPEAIARLTNWLGLLFFLGLCAFVYWDSRRAKPPEPED